MMQIEALYDDDSFNDLLVKYAMKRGIYAFDDFRQDVFLAIVAERANTRARCAKIANKISQQYNRATVESSVDDYSYVDDSGAVESAGEVMSRLIYHKTARQVC